MKWGCQWRCTPGQIASNLSLRPQICRVKGLDETTTTVPATSNILWVGILFQVTYRKVSGEKNCPCTFALCFHELQIFSLSPNLWSFWKDRFMFQVISLHFVSTKVNYWLLHYGHKRLFFRHGEILPPCQDGSVSMCASLNAEVPRGFSEAWEKVATFHINFTIVSRIEKF